ncbi:hypothetical protein J5069_22645 [Candidatus Symbiopectobacterium sp. NZEC127]|uniref:hypothetical protein n=1 Tax=Candidatus Symbiopectobacterium sp. NZEC127 TaxID=2820472 RepID=UPI00222657AE|nr:hypothetical protein [Candidatus Symbiopectobacterium sp. NZEC127]MCW2488703.1 hypothetical protein [Candidatus Symbiopectobacterium sp. NZEC127]
MKLFFDTKSNNKNTAVKSQKKKFAQPILIISPSPDVMSDIVSQLLMHHLADVIPHEADFFTMSDNPGASDAIAVIVDINDVDNVELIMQMVALLIPVSAKPILVGNNDSIRFAHALMIAGANYLHIGSQLPQLPDLIRDPIPAAHNRATMKISILGCKGGAGASTVAHQLFKAAGMLTSIPMLLVQGCSGSRDLDLLLAKALPSDGSIADLTAHQSVKMETCDAAWLYEDTAFNRYNLVFFDHGIHTHVEQQLEQVFMQSHVIVLVISRALASLRVAKNILEEHKRFLLANPLKEVRILLCLNESHPKNTDELVNADIEEYLGLDIFSVNAYNVHHNPLSSESALYRLAAHLLGKSLGPPSSRKTLFTLPTFLRPARQNAAV